MANKLITMIAALAVFALIATYGLGLSYTALPFWFFLGAMLFLGNMVLGKTIPIPVTKKIATYALVIFVVGFAFTGGYLDGMLGGAVAGTVVSMDDTTITGTSADAAALCQAQAGNQAGISATIPLEVYDREANTETNINAFDGWVVDQYGNKKVDDTVSMTVTASVGDVLSFYGGGNASYYFDKKENVCILTSGQTVSLDAHAISAETNIDIVAYDNTGTTVLTTGTTGEEDYELALGASQSDIIYLKVTNNVADKSFDFTGWATLANGDVDSFYPMNDDLGGTYNIDYLPYWLGNGAHPHINETGGVTPLNVTGWDSVYTRNNVVRLSEWDYFKTKFSVTSSSAGTDAQDGASSSLTSDVGMALAFDSSWTKDSNGNVVYSYYLPAQGSSSEVNVGMAELPDSPIGGYEGVVIEFT